MPSAVHMAYVITRKDSLLLLIGAGKMREKLNFEVYLSENYFDYGLGLGALPFIWFSCTLDLTCTVSQSICCLQNYITQFILTNWKNCIFLNAFELLGEIERIRSLIKFWLFSKRCRCFTYPTRYTTG